VSLTQVCRDRSLLVPAFDAAIEALLADMRALGWNPYVFETYRTAERGKLLQAAGKSRNGDRSMHRYWCAVDIVDADLHNVPRMTKEGYWDAPAKFWSDLGACAAKHRLVWGGDWDANPGTPQRMYDLPHVQAVALGEQDHVRAMSKPQIAEYVRQRLTA
jgi:hypothetical protein